MRHFPHSNHKFTLLRITPYHNVEHAIMLKNQIMQLGLRGSELSLQERKQTQDIRVKCGQPQALGGSSFWLCGVHSPLSFPPQPPLHRGQGPGARGPPGGSLAHSGEICAQRGPCFQQGARRKQSRRHGDLTRDGGQCASVPRISSFITFAAGGAWPVFPVAQSALLPPVLGALRPHVCVSALRSSGPAGPSSPAETRPGLPPHSKTPWGCC